MTKKLLVRHFETEMAAVPNASGSLGRVQRRVLRRRATRRLASAAIMLVFVLGVVSLMVPSLPRIAAADGPDTPTRLLIDGDVEVLVTDEPIAEVETRTHTLTVYGGLPGPNPAFDLTELGDEQPLVQNQPVWGNIEPGNVPVVYIGDVNGRSVFLHTNGGITLLDRLSAWIGGSEIGPHLCLSVGESETLGASGFCTGPGSTHEGRSITGALHVDNAPEGEGSRGYYVTWFALPEGTALVALELDDGRRLWQRPRGETVLFDLGDYVGPTRLAALDVEGSVLYEVGPDVHKSTDEVYGEEYDGQEIEIPPPEDSTGP